MIFVGVDWAETHHDVCVLDSEGNVLGRRRILDSFAGVGELHALVAEHLGDDEDSQVVVGIEKDRGPIVTALLAANYQVYGINPMASARYRDRHHVSGAKSDPGDAKVLADLVRADRHNHRALAGDSALVNGVQVLARPPERHLGPSAPGERPAPGAKGLLPRRPRGVRDRPFAHGRGRGALRGADPALGRSLSRAKLVAALKHGGRQRHLDERAKKIP